MIHRFESKFQRVPKGEHPGALAHPEIAYTGDWEDFSECWAEPADEGESWLWVRRARDGHRIVTVVKADPADVPRVEREVA